MSSSPSSVFAEQLASRRTRFNAQFADTRRFRPSLDPESFKTHLRDTVAPIVELAAASAPGQAAVVTEVLYDLSLELVGQDLLGPRSRLPALALGWQRLLPALAPYVAEAPRLFAGAVTNALYHLATTPGAHPEAWIESVLSLAGWQPGAAALLEAAQMAAWRAGLAHYRLGALDVCRRLPPALAAAALGLPDQAAAAVTPASLERALSRLRDDPWLAPERAFSGLAPQAQLRLVRRVGAFRGFGGQFLAPPTVTCPAGQFVVADGDALWLLCADRFGATLHRTAAPPGGPAAMREPFYRLDSRGKVTRGKHSAVFADLAGSQSSAADHATLAVTTPLSHAVFLVALAEP